MDRSKNRFESILETIGHTPVVKIKKLAPAHVSLYVKIEAFNPMGSVKDRLALGIIEDAERSGRNVHLDAYSFLPAWLHPR